MFRQGDILIIPREFMPEGEPTNTKILREGSMTGHHHILKKGVIYLQRIDGDGVFAHIVAYEGCQLVHDEHNTIEIPVGMYEVRRQKEVTGYVED